MDRVNSIDRGNVDRGNHIDRGNVDRGNHIDRVIVLSEVIILIEVIGGNDRSI